MKRRTPTPSQKIVKKHKAKARWLQNWVCERVSELTRIPYGRDELIESRQMGQGGVDVCLRGEALEKFPFSVECASGEKIGWTSKVRQARKNRKDGTDWLLFLKRKEFQNPVVLMDANVFFQLMKRLEEFEEDGI